jgi:signal transduction histidine kinase
VRLRCDAAPALTAVLNRSTFRLVLINLLGNALDACTSGGTVTVAAHPIGEELDVAVIDDGCGMADDVRERATELFFSTKSRGSGIGLALVHQILRRGGGELSIDSTPDTGTAVRLRIPQGDTR